MLEKGFKLMPRCKSHGERQELFPDKLRACEESIVVGRFAGFQHRISQIRFQGAGVDESFGSFESRLLDEVFDRLEQSLAFFAGHPSAPVSGQLDEVKSFFSVSLGSAKTVINPAASAFIAQSSKEQFFELVNPGA